MNKPQKDHCNIKRSKTISSNKINAQVEDSLLIDEEQKGLSRQAIFRKQKMQIHGNGKSLCLINRFKR
jgi:hypothetical protein